MIPEPCQCDVNDFCTDTQHWTGTKRIAGDSQHVVTRRSNLLDPTLRKRAPKVGDEQDSHG